jgi:cytochrome c
MNEPLHGDMGMTRRLMALVLGFGMATGPAAAQDGNADAGSDVFKKCRACHAVGADATNKVGPILNGLIGRKSGSIEGFAYSPANVAAGEAGLVWTDAKFLEYITDPRAFMPGNKMAFAGVKDEQDRKDLLAYLKQQK